MKSKTITKPVTLLSQITELVDKHIATMEAILTDYSVVIEESIDLELKASLENLKNAVAELEYQSFDDLLNEVKEHDEFDDNEVLKIIDLDEIDDDKLLAACDETSLMGWATDAGYAVINLKGSMVNAAKLKDFIQAEIYPHLNEEENYSI